MTLKLILAFVIAFAVSAVVGFFLVPYLRRIKAGQSIKENGPTWHMSKQGTPTMGGLMFIAAIAVVCLSVGFECMAEGEYGHLFCLAFALVLYQVKDQFVSLHGVLFGLSFLFFFCFTFLLCCGLSSSNA